jgi:hypothetical protein
MFHGSPLIAAAASCRVPVSTPNLSQTNLNNLPRHIILPTSTPGSLEGVFRPVAPVFWQQKIAGTASAPDNGGLGGLGAGRGSTD